VIESDLENAVVGGSGGDHLACLCRVEGERLLAEYVLARRECSHGNGVVQGVGSSDADDVELGKRHELLPVVEQEWHAVLVAQLGATIDFFAGERDHFDSVEF